MMFLIATEVKLKNRGNTEKEIENPKLKSISHSAGAHDFA
jgi:hypothetical protein